VGIGKEVKMSIDLTKILAFWGAILSTFAVGWQFFRDFSKRSRLRVRCYIGNYYYLKTLEKVNKDFFIVDIVNIGGEAVIITLINGETENKEKFMLIPEFVKLPYLIKPKEFITIPFSLSLIPKNLKKVEVKDSIGKSWKAPGKDIKLVKGSINKGKKINDSL